MRYRGTIGILFSFGFASVGCTGQGEAVEVQRDSNALIVAESPAQILIAQPYCNGTHLRQIASSIPSGLAASTGNLYWTSNAVDEFGPDTATVWRTAKSSTPGQERALDQVRGDPVPQFGNLVWALVDGQYYGYYAVTSGSASWINRVPLGGGSSTVLVSSPAAIRAGDVASNGETLAWVDEQCVRTMPIRGGAVHPILCGAGLSAHLVLDRYFVYVSSGSTVSRMSVTGDFYGVMLSGHQNITAFSLVISTSGQAFAGAWGEQDGSVYQQPLSPIEYPKSLQAPSAGREVTSIRLEGSAVWTECDAGTHAHCVLKSALLGDPDGVLLLANAAVGAGFVQLDQHSYFWGDAAGLHACSL